MVVNSKRCTLQIFCALRRRVGGRSGTMWASSPTGLWCKAKKKLTKGKAMIPIFRRINVNDRNLDISALAASINEMQEEIESCISELSSDNLSEISTDMTKISSALGSELKGDMLRLRGRGGEKFAVGYDKDTGLFEFCLTDKNGDYIFVYNEKDGLIIGEADTE